MRIYKLLCISIIIAYSTCSAITYKCNTPPVTMLEEVSNHLITDYKNKKAVLKNKKAITAYANSTAEEAIMPSLDAEYMAKQVVGRYHWNNSKKKDRDEFVKAYKKAISDEYTRFLLKFGNKEKYLKFHPSRKKTGEQAVVFAIINNKKKSSTIGFYLHCVNNTVIKDLPHKTWMIYDISFDNISFLDQFKATVSSTIRNSGLPGLTKKIKEYNAEQQRKSE